MEKIITYLEITEPGAVRPAPAVPALGLRLLENDSPLVRTVPARIGEAYGWRSSSRTDAQWRAFLAEHPRRQFWLVTHDGEPAGAACLEPQPGGDVEIATFGLLPEYVGRGLGGYALTLALRQAWSTEPVGADAVRRVWLHTNSHDHPRALENYTRRGMCPYRVEVVES